MLSSTVPRAAHPRPDPSQPFTSPSSSSSSSPPSPTAPIRASAAVRVSKDLTELSLARWSAQSDVRITLPSSTHAQHLHVAITPQHGLYARSTFLFSLHLPSSYPFSPPHVRCLTPTLHPFISARSGRVHHPILHEQWKPVLSLNTVVFALQLLFFLDHTPPPYPTPHALHMQGGREGVGGEDGEGGREGGEAGSKESAGRGRGGGGGGGGCVSRECEEEVRDMMERDRALFEHSVQQTLDGGFFFGIHWPRNRPDEGNGRDGGGVEERKESGGPGGAEGEEEDEEKARKRRGQLGLKGARGEDDGDEEGEEDDGCRRRHKAPHRHFQQQQQQSRSTAPPSTFPPTPFRARRPAGVRGVREERKEGDDVSMVRTDSFSLATLRSSLPPSPPPIPPLPSPSLSALASSTSSTAASLYSLQSSSLAKMQRLHALKTSMWTAAPREAQPPQPLQRPTTSTSSAAPAQPSDAGPPLPALTHIQAARGAESLSSPVRSLSTVMTDG